MQYRIYLLGALSLCSAQSLTIQDLKPFYSDISAYLSPLSTNPTASAVSSALVSINVILANQLLQPPEDPNLLAPTTPPPGYTLLPSAYQSFADSIYYHEQSIASHYSLVANGTGLYGFSIVGFTLTTGSGPASTAAATPSATMASSSSKGAAALPTGVALLGVCAGLVGGIAAVL